MTRRRISTVTFLFIAIAASVVLFQARTEAANTVNQPGQLQAFFTPRLELSPWFMFNLSSGPSNTETIGYTIEIDDASNFATPVYKYTQPSILTQGRAVHQIPRKIITQDGTYYWRVTAHNVDNTSSNTSTIETLTFSTCVPTVNFTALPDNRAEVNEAITFDGTSSAPTICTTGAASNDRDGDTILDTPDNCPDVSNLNQADADGDTRGDVCDRNETVTSYSINPLSVTLAEGQVLRTMIATFTCTGGPCQDWHTLGFGPQTGPGDAFVSGGIKIMSGSTISITGISAGNVDISTCLNDPGPGNFCGVDWIDATVTAASLRIGNTWIKENNGVALEASNSGIGKLQHLGNTIYALATNSGIPPSSKVYASTTQGVTWTPKVDIYNDLGLSYGSSMASRGFSLYVGAPNRAGTAGKVARSSDFGQTWSLTNANFPGPNPGTINVSALLHTGSTLYAGTFQSPGNALIYRTTNEGSTWSASGALPANINRIWSIIDKSNVLYAGTGSSGKIISSTDGIAWTEKTKPTPTVTNVYQLLYVGTMMYAATNEGVFKSTDNAQTWTATGNLGVATGNSPVALSYAGNTLYTAIDGSPDGGKVFSSTDGGTTWVLTSVLPGATRATSLLNMGNKLYAAGTTSGSASFIYSNTLTPLTGNPDLSYRWIWGDGTTCPASFPGTGPAIDFFTCSATETHTYTDDGLYTPVLFVRDKTTGRMNWYTTTIMVGDQMDLYTVGRYKDSTDNGGNDFASLVDAPVRVIGRDTQTFEIMSDAEYQLEVGPQALGKTTLTAATPGGFPKYEEDFAIPVSTLPKAFNGATIPPALYTDLKCIAGKECDFSTVRLYTDPALTDEYLFEDNSGQPYGDFGFRSRSTNPDKNFLIFFDKSAGAAWNALYSLNLAPEKIYPNEYSLTHLLADGITAVESYLLASKGLIDTQDNTLHLLADDTHIFKTDDNGHLLIKLSNLDTKLAGIVALEMIIEQVLDRSTVPLNPFTIQLEIRPDVIATDSLSQTQLTVREMNDRRPLYADDALLAVKFDDDTATARDGTPAAVTGATYAQGVIFTGATPPASRAIVLNATTNLSYDDTTDVDVFNEDNGTIAAWVRPTWNGNDNQAHVLFDNYVDASNYLRIYKTTGNMLRFEMKANGTTSTAESSIATWTQNTWYFVTATWDGVRSTMTLYVNGKPVAQRTPITTPTALSPDLNIGWSADPALTGRTLNAHLDDLFVFINTLNGTQIKDWYSVYVP